MKTFKDYLEVQQDHSDLKNMSKEQLKSELIKKTALLNKAIDDDSRLNKQSIQSRIDEIKKELKR